ncbi:MAG: glycosyltransferase [Candidatus Symbiobacter sp.]|nr:glycosyltransferase [Candidatus Symbiobacter sp.]
MKSNLVDVVMTSYNKGRYIGKALDSIFSQKTDKIAQIYICDDCSTDHTLEVIRHYQANYPGKITLIENKFNLGMCKNTRKSFFQGNSPFVAALDADDIWTNENKIELMVKALIDNPELIGCLHNFIVIKDDVIVQNDWPSPKIKHYLPDELTKLSMKNLLSAPIWDSILFHGNFLMLRRKIIEQIFTPKFIPYYDNSNIGDSFRFGIFNLMEKDPVFGYFSEPMGVWLLNDSSQTIYTNKVKLYVHILIMHANYRIAFKESHAINFICTYAIHWYYAQIKELIKQARQNGQNDIATEAYNMLINCGNDELLNLVDFNLIFGEKMRVTIARDVRRLGLVRFSYSFINRHFSRLCRTLFKPIRNFYARLCRFFRNTSYHIRLFGRNKLANLSEK